MPTRPDDPRIEPSPEQDSAPDTRDASGRRLRQQAILSEFGVEALRATDLDPLLQRATELCAEGMDAEYCKALEYLRGEDTLLVRAGVGWKPHVIGHARVGADLASPAGFALKTGRPVISNHLADETRFRTPQLMADHGIRRAINVLIENRDGAFGVLEVDDSREGMFEEADIAFMQGFANLLGSAIERQRTEGLLRAALARQDLLAREMSHRVKNSLAIVASLLTLQARSHEGEPAVLAALQMPAAAWKPSPPCTTSSGARAIRRAWTGQGRRPPARSTSRPSSTSSSATSRAALRPIA